MEPTASDTPLVLFRAWRLAPAQAVVLSLYRSVEWPPDGTIRAACIQATAGLSFGHDSPDDRCTCGIHGYYRFDDVVKRFGLGAGYVYGAVMATGRTLEGA